MFCEFWATRTRDQQRLHDTRRWHLQVVIIGPEQHVRSRLGRCSCGCWCGRRGRRRGRSRGRGRRSGTYRGRSTGTGTSTSASTTTGSGSGSALGGRSRLCVVPEEVQHHRSPRLLDPCDDGTVAKAKYVLSVNAAQAASHSIPFATHTTHAHTSLATSAGLDRTARRTGHRCQ